MPLFERKDASAVVLPVQAVFSGKLSGTFVAVSLFEIAGKPVDMVFQRKFFSDFIQLLRVFQRTDGQRCGKVIAVPFSGRACRFGKPQAIAGKTSLPPFGELFHSSGTVIECFRKINALCKIDGVPGGKFLYKADLFLHTGMIFRCRINIRVIVKDCDFKIFRQIFQHIAAARGAAGVQKKRWNLLFAIQFLNEFIQFFLEISFIHTDIPPLLS